MVLHGCFNPTMSFSPNSSAHLPKVSCPELQSLFSAYSSNGVMSSSEFYRFLQEIQMEPNLTEDAAINIMQSYAKALPVLQLCYEQFLTYLFDVDQNFAIHNHVHHDMTLPLTHYYIFTGHNSYLTGNQLSSASSQKPIARALCKGVRVVELDLWPSEDGIHVFHGRTLTSKVEFEKCLKAIKDNAFSNSPYPVIITLEDHLTPDLQDKAAKKIMEILGEHLYYPESFEEMKSYPSPEALKNKILISTKPPQRRLDSDKEQPESEWDSSSSNDEDTEHFKETEEGNWSDEIQKPPELRNEEFVSQDYTRIITIRGGKTKGKSLAGSLRTEENPKRVSISEPQLSKIAASDPSSIIQFTCNNFLRIYPKGLRIDSSNYNPIKPWAFGAQMVALNMQGYGKHLWVTHGFFRANGGCGYVKKPNYLMLNDSGTSTEILHWNSKTLEAKLKLKVRVYMGYGWHEQFGRKKFDIFSPPDFYTRVGIAGVKADSLMTKTSIIYNKWEPIWDKEFEFTIHVPELAVLRIEVLENDKTTPDEFAGQICLPLSELKSGYRVVPLCDKRSDPYEHVRLLLHLEYSSFNGSIIR